MRHLLIGLLAMLPLLTRAQKVKIEGEKVTVDGADFALMEKDGCGTFSPNCNYTFKNLQGKPVLVIKRGIENVPSEVSPANPDGGIVYLDFNFLNSKQKGQLSRVRLKTEKIIERIVKAHLFKDGDLDEEAANNFVLINPLVYGIPKKEVIIQEVSPQPKRGVHIQF